MAVKKTSVETEEKKKDVVKDAGATKVKTVEEPASFCVYIGPSIRGVIQTNTIYEGSKKETETKLADEIGKYPLIKRLIVTDKSLAEDRIKVKTAGSPLNQYFKKLASGNMN